MACRCEKKKQLRALKVSHSRRIVVTLSGFECETDFWTVRSMLAPMAGVRDVLVSKNRVSFQAPEDFDASALIQALEDLGYAAKRKE